VLQTVHWQFIGCWTPSSYTKTSVNITWEFQCRMTWMWGTNCYFYVIAKPLTPHQGSLHTLKCHRVFTQATASALTGVWTCNVSFLFWPGIYTGNHTQRSCVFKHVLVIAAPVNILWYNGYNCGFAIRKHKISNLYPIHAHHLVSYPGPRAWNIEKCVVTLHL